MTQEKCPPISLAKIIRKLEEGSEVIMAGLGDSLTQGWMVTRSFFDLFVDGLEARFPRGSVRRINAGVPGDTARGGLERVNRIVGHSPDLVVIQFGLNDLFCGVSVNKFEESVRGIAARVRDCGAVPLLATSCPLTLKGDQAKASHFYDIIRGIGGERGAVLADIDEYWRNRSPVEPLLVEDGIHPSDEGHRLMAQCVLALFG